MNLSNKNVMVVGTGISGIGAVNLLNRAGACVILYDSNEKLNKSDIEKKLDGSRAQIIIGKLDDDIVENTDLLVITEDEDCNEAKIRISQEQYSK